MRRRLPPRPFVLLPLLLALAACDHYAAAGVPQTPQVTPVASPAPRPGQEPGPASCTDVATTVTTAIVETLRLADGSCVPPAQTLVYRCDPAFDPVAVLDLGGEARRFLGGAYAVPVDALPDGARPLGVSAAGRLYADPSDPRWLFVEAGGMVERWLALPDRLDVSAPPTAQLIGDSILDGAQTAVTETLSGWQVSIDAVVGRSSSGGIAPAEALTPPLPDVVVVELGVNDHDASVFRQNADRILAAAGGADLVVWMTAHGPDPTVDAIDHEIISMMGAIPNGAIVDWDRAVPPEILSSDGIHPLAGNEGVFAGILTPVLETWRLAATGGGPTRCDAAVTDVVLG